MLKVKFTLKRYLQIRMRNMRFMWIFFPDAQSSKTTKLLAFLVFIGSRLGGTGSRLGGTGSHLGGTESGLDGTGSCLDRTGSRLDRTGSCLGRTGSCLNMT